jgi:hypothetical protein
LAGSLGSLVAAVGTVVFVNDIARQPPVFGYRESLPLRPGTYVATSLPACRGSDPASRPVRVDQPGMFHERCNLAPELDSMPGAQVDLVVPAVQPELHSLIRRTASQVVLQAHFHPLHHNPPSCRLRLAAGQR